MTMSFGRSDAESVLLRQTVRPDDLFLQDTVPIDMTAVLLEYPKSVEPAEPAEPAERRASERETTARDTISATPVSDEREAAVGDR
ncbi:hypothetical protein HQQ88_13260 [Curtobacterium sp. VKM Ac-2861]|uniref:hypothetical protein n=1 Tax=unclassified Curtobacterium TaxID=257496 RepID=UPI000F46C38E|nr:MULTISPECIES: hypothetical protein [unclassified Curtobacterium]NQW91258.1 hypothetical protein [Curtobacterium sp. VKM Ac-2861]ROQ17517.1 hypothetical protein EDF41_0553 [Curtobacterium sp. PhB171]ROQ29238.1 hypothetical protein EDF40_0471 [Curtobacterium sp. PhB170]ROS36450.1 hypothetical protein EDF53_2418 [Curtobacterium sp. PhB78]ROS45618.1 hypothetical protein EDF25_0378 [Curtobacterium sp. PhB131]